MFICKLRKGQLLRVNNGFLRQLVSDAAPILRLTRNSEAVSLLLLHLGKPYSAPRM